MAQRRDKNIIVCLLNYRSIHLGVVGGLDQRDKLGLYNVLLKDTARLVSSDSVAKKGI